MKEIQAWLGHSTIGTTANIYTHLDENSKINSANAIIGILEQKKDTQSISSPSVRSQNGAANRTRLHYCVGVVEPPPRDSPPDCPIGWVRVLCDNKKQTPKPGICFPGAANRTRTGTESLQVDFKCYPLFLQ